MKKFVLAVTLLVSIKVSAQTLENDRLALVALYEATNGNANWTNKTGWVVPGTVGDNPCGWFGVTCNTAGDRVVELNLPHNRLGGTLPAEIGNLTALTRLDLDQATYLMDGYPYRDNDLAMSGAIPTELGNLVNLEYLDLGGNVFSGSIPASIGSLVNLQHLDLSYAPFDVGFDRFGKLSGPIPDLSALPSTARVSINNQSFTFEGMEQNITKLAQYSPQNIVELYKDKRYQLGDPEYDPEQYQEYLWINAGGTESLNEYKLFEDGHVLFTQTGSKWFVYRTGTYKIQVTNAGVPGLTLISNEDFFFAGPIPVRLIDFTVRSNNAQNLLTWQTASESRNTGFDVEKSPDAKTFEKIGFVDGKGDAKDVSKYTFTDSNPYATTYYRLKQLDFDGKFEYSRIISVKNDALAVVVYPNPAQNQLFLMNVGKPEQILIKNFDGETLLKQMASSQIPINTGNLASGLYFITIGSETRKVVIQK